MGIMSFSLAYNPLPPLGTRCEEWQIERSQAIIQVPHSAQSAGEFSVGQDGEPASLTNVAQPAKPIL